MNMTPAQVAHIMSLVEEYAVLREHGSAAQYDAAGRAVEAALLAPQQAEPLFGEMIAQHPGLREEMLAESERAEFEAWAIENPYIAAKDSWNERSRYGEKEYEYHEVQLMWEAWQARAIVRAAAALAGDTGGEAPTSPERER